MNVDADRITRLRTGRTWSQDELATAAGLSLRTVQRIENGGTASLQSLKALAAAFEVDLERLKQSGEKDVARFEYKTVVLPFKMGIFKKGLPDIQSELNKNGLEGWRFRQIILPSSEWGSSDRIVAILERPLG